MPLPTPKPNEPRNEYVSRCIAFETKASPNRPKAQVIAMCEQNFTKHHQVHLQGAIQTKVLGNAMIIEGTLLKPGIWVGLDGVPTKYSEAFIQKVKDSIIGKPIYFAHDISPESMDWALPKGTTVGFFTGVKDGGKLNVRGYVFNPRALHYLKEHPNIGLSMEAQVTGWDAGGFEVAEDGILTGGALIDDPACPTCRVESAREINLERGKKEGNKMDTNSTTEEFIEFKADAKPGKEEFFTWIEKQLKDAGVPNAIIPKVMAELKKAIKIPYPYPYPKAQELAKILAGNEEFAKHLSEYTDFMKTCMAGGKTMKECTTEWGTKQKTETPEKPEKLEESEELKTMKAELEATKKILDQRTEEEITGIVSGIKEFDKEFTPDKFLEGIEYKQLQKKVLQKYLETLKKHARPIKLQIGEDAAKATVTKEVDEMFGKGATLNSILEIPESGK